MSSSSCPREGAMNAFAVPSLVNGQRVPRSAPKAIEARASDYTPQDGSTVARVLAHLEAHPELTGISARQIADKWGVAVAGMNTLMRKAIATGVLVFEPGADGALGLYRLPSRAERQERVTPAPPPAAAAPAPEPAAEPVTDADAAAPSPAEPPAASTSAPQRFIGADVLRLYDEAARVLGELMPLLGLGEEATIARIPNAVRALQADRLLFNKNWEESEAAFDKLVDQYDELADVVEGATGRRPEPGDDLSAIKATLADASVPAENQRFAATLAAPSGQPIHIHVHVGGAA